MSSHASIETRVQGLVAAVVEATGLGERVATAECARADWPDTLRPEEAALVADNHPDARAEFAAGRACAHAALAKLGAPDGPLARLGGEGNAARAPAWPDGFTGSISHASDWCAAIAAARRDFAAVGLDLEAASRVTPKILARVCTERERAHLETPDASWPGALHFAAKEAFYKVWSPVMRREIGFRDVEVRPAGEGRFEVELVGDVDPGALGPGPFEGAFATQGDLVAAIVIVPAS